ncbi:hypothetical protein [Terriglobus sp. TAA 43]|uniref:hypothetical protein n=1 Tax=Terriglobus sp. TAA 43 TaxID=278961 RepID=UPI000646DFBB|nr:hypothetical protein [Terriglobus sp. TAA 43]
MEYATVEGTLETGIAPEQILRVLEQPELLPHWAPAFADRVEPGDEGAWHVTKNDTAFEIRVETSRVAMITQFSREIAGGQTVGAVIRLVHRIGGGCILNMRLPLGDPSNRETVQNLLREELNNLVDLTQSLLHPTQQALGTA